MTPYVSVTALDPIAEHPEAGGKKPLEGTGRRLRSERRISPAQSSVQPNAEVPDPAPARPNVRLVFGVPLSGGLARLPDVDPATILSQPLPGGVVEVGDIAHALAPLIRLQCVSIAFG